MRKSIFVHCCFLIAWLFCLSTPSVCGADNDVKVTFEDVSSQMIIIQFERGGKELKALGVIVNMEEGPYLLTSQTVLLGAGKLKFMTADGDLVVPKSVELSNNRDLARLALSEELDSLELSTDKMKMNTEITLISCGADRSTRLREGKVIGLGGPKFEVSLEFKDSEIGAPFISPQGDVVGIASHSLESWKHVMKKGTRFDDATRYFGFRADSSGWKKVNWRKYNKQFGLAYSEYEALEGRILAILRKGGDVRISAKEAREIAIACRMNSTKIERLIELRGMTSYLMKEFAKQAELFGYAEEFFSDYADAH